MYAGPWFLEQNEDGTDDDDGIQPYLSGNDSDDDDGDKNVSTGASGPRAKQRRCVQWNDTIVTAPAVEIFKAREALPSGTLDTKVR